MQSRPADFNSRNQSSKYSLTRGGTDKVAAYQEMLNKKLGLNLKVDGAWGPATQAAYEKYKKMSATNSNSSKNWYTTKQWDNATKSQAPTNELPSVDLPRSSGIKRRGQGGMVVPRVNGTVMASTPMPKQGQSFTSRKPGSANLKDKAKAKLKKK
jgi:hypothetical protein